MESARAALRHYFGYGDFRPGQIDVIAAVLSGSDTLGVLPTGGGKSLCYQVPALVLPGLTVVISPLISLMKDQVDRLLGRNVPATFLNSTLGANEVSSRLSRAARGELKLLYVAPERFEAADVHRCLSRCTLSLLAVDEAHCISEWGHEFRPSFRRIAAVSQKLGFQQVVALTATATPVVRQDIVRQLNMRRPRVIVGGFDRANLRYAVRECRNDAEKDKALLKAMKSYARPAIVYASTRSAVERIAKLLTRSGVRALPYHGGLDDAHRHEVQETFMTGGVDTIVATNAFGMGIDKPNVRLVVHYTMPGTLEAYYQEAGRAGRDGLPGDCLLLHAFRDRFTHEWFIRGMFPERQAVRRVYDAIRASHRNGQVTPTPAGKDSDSAIRLLLQHKVLLQQRGTSPRVRVRLLATPNRISRELGSSATAIELGVLRALWRQGGAALEQGCVVDLDGLPPGIRGRTARDVLARLRDRQFVDVTVLGEEMYLSIPDASFEALRIDWNALALRATAEREKLDMMQRYTYTKNCRRAFVLRYFGERTTNDGSAGCGGCDNCPSR
ncbi:MAG: ATP-dependent DNA helicase RecQ [Gemmatimonadaceae bacterium]